MSEKYKIKSFDDGKIILTPPPSPPSGKPFVTKWHVIPGEVFKLGVLSAPPFSVRGTINWGDGSQDEQVTGSYPGHIYTEGDIGEDSLVTITFTGTATMFQSNPYSTYTLKRIDEWGSIGLTKFSVRGYHDIEYINTELPASITNLNGAFSYTTSLPDITGLKTGNVKNMSGLFRGSTNFNQKISEWDTSSLDNAESMFKDCRAFNQNISNWNVLKIKIANSMFFGCTSFNQDISKWKMTVDQGQTMFENTFPLWRPDHKPVVNDLPGGLQLAP